MLCAQNLSAGAVNERTGWDLAIHIDGASGAFVAPFLFPDIKWDFRLKNVASINISGHKWVCMVIMMNGHMAANFYDRGDTHSDDLLACNCSAVALVSLLQLVPFSTGMWLLAWALKISLPASHGQLQQQI